MAQWPYSTAAWRRLRRLNGEAPCRRSVLPPTAWHRPRHPPESESRMAFAVVASVFHAPVSLPCLPKSASRDATPVLCRHRHNVAHIQRFGARSPGAAPAINGSLPPKIPPYQSSPAAHDR